MKLMTLIARSFVENCEFKEQQFRGLKTDEMITRFFKQQAQLKQEKIEKSSNDDFAELNLCIYVLIRDNKLLELRQRFEQQKEPTLGSQDNRTIQFLFKICQRNGLDFNSCLERIREQESEVYLHLNKIAKELGLKEPH